MSQGGEICLNKQDNTPFPAQCTGKEERCEGFRSLGLHCCPQASDWGKSKCWDLDSSVYNPGFRYQGHQLGCFAQH